MRGTSRWNLKVTKRKQLLVGVIVLALLGGVYGGYWGIRLVRVRREVARIVECAEEASRFEVCRIINAEICGTPVAIEGEFGGFFDLLRGSATGVMPNSVGQSPMRTRVSFYAEGGRIARFEIDDMGVSTLITYSTSECGHGMISCRFWSGWRCAVSQEKSWKSIERQSSNRTRTRAGRAGEVYL